jgi:peroxiredoxin
MRCSFRVSLFAGLLACGCGSDARAEPEPGTTVADFTLRDIHRRPRSLTAFKDSKAVVVVFLGVDCSQTQDSLTTLRDLHGKYADRGVQFLGVNSMTDDLFVEVSAHAQDNKLPFHVLKDFDQKVADQFGAKTTMVAFLLDAKRVVHYRGAVSGLPEALEELLAGKAVSRATTEVKGTPIERIAKPRVKEEITYSKHVARILQNRCQECHRPGEIGPMPLLTYEHARSWANMMHEVVVEERMPPWYADPRFGKFANDRRLPRDEAQTLLAWVEQGCPRGDEKDMPPARTFPKGWVIGKPDAIYQMPEEYKVQATGVLPYIKFTVDPGFKEDVWIQAAECRPGNRAVVHHILVYIKQPGKPFYLLDGTASTLVGWAPGDMPARWRPGTAKLIPAGSSLVFEVHYTPNGTEQTDRSSIGVIFAKKPPEHQAETNILANMALRLPAGEPNYRGQMNYTFPRDALLLSFMPHMHLRGTSARYEAEYPDGRTETLLSVPDYDFDWQSVYAFKEPLHIPKGTKLRWIATWDNSPDNPRNPDPSKAVRWGLQTWDEMQNGWMEVVWKKAEKESPER